jgi:hypothetical protein
MDKCLSDAIVYALACVGCLFFQTFEPEKRQLLAEVMDTIKSLEEY